MHTHTSTKKMPDTDFSKYSGHFLFKIMIPLTCHMFMYQDISISCIHYYCLNWTFMIITGVPCVGVYDWFRKVCILITQKQRLYLSQWTPWRQVHRLTGLTQAPSPPPIPLRHKNLEKDRKSKSPHLHLHLSLNCGSHLGTSVDFTTEAKAYITRKSIS